MCTEILWRGCCSRDGREKPEFCSCLNPQGMKYNKELMLECVLLKSCIINMRRKNVVALPSKTTLLKYTAQYKSGYGFNEKILSVLEKIVSHLHVFY